MEVKNRDNTIKGKDGSHIVNILKKHASNGKKAVLCEVNCPNGKVKHFADSKSTIEVWNGKQTYAYLSGRETFFDDLLSTTQYAFANYKTFEDLKKALETA